MQVNSHGFINSLFVAKSVKTTKNVIVELFSRVHNPNCNNKPPSLTQGYRQLPTQAEVQGRFQSFDFQN